ncbi:MAG: hypothetical protein IPM16_15790 [Chloroflexi bacterium]|nr:hypothetical protein [Chloroflexota bacterium]
MTRSAPFSFNGEAARAAEDWKRGLAEPDRQWKPGYSAWALAHSWMAADGFPPEVRDVLEPAFPGIRMRQGLIEHKVPMPGKGRDSQNDLFVIAEAGGERVCIAVEGKVAESFGPTVGQWRDGSANKEQRLVGICARIGLADPVPPSIRYQLLHRAASPVIEALQRGAKHAVMLIHSFAVEDMNFADYAAFAALYGVGPVRKGPLVRLALVDGVTLYAAWVTGDPSFLR